MRSMIGSVIKEGRGRGSSCSVNMDMVRGSMIKDVVREDVE